MKKRFLALLLSLCMVFSAFPFGVVAEEAAPSELRLDETVSVTVREDSTMRFSFTPESDGVYELRRDEMDSASVYVSVQDAKGTLVANMMEDSSIPQWSLKGGESYWVVVEFRYYGEQVSEKVSFCMLRCSETRMFSFEKASVIGLEGRSEYVSVYFGEGCVAEPLTWTVEDPTIVSLGDQYPDSNYGSAYGKYGQGCTLEFLKAGTTTLTVSIDGVSKSIPITVKGASDYPLLNENEEHSFREDALGYHYYRFTPADDGIFRIRISFREVSGYKIGYSVGEAYDAEGGVVPNFNGVTGQWELKGGETYLLSAYCDVYEENEPAAVDLAVEVEVVRCTQSGQFTLDSENIMGQAGTTAQVVLRWGDNFIVEPVTWSVVDSSVAEVFEEWDGRNSATCKVRFLSEGTTNLVASTPSGASATVSITVLPASVLSELRLNEVYCETVRGGDILEYVFTPEEDGVYGFCDEGRSVGFDAAIYNSNGNHTYYEGNSDQYELKAGETYRVSLTAYEYFGNTTGVADDVSFYLYRCIPDGALIMDQRSVKGMAGMVVRVTATWEDRAQVDNVIWTIDDPTVAEIADIYGWMGSSHGEGAYVKLLKEGTTTVTATSKKGAKASAEVISVPAVDIALGEEKMTQIPKNVNYEYVPVFRFVPEEDGVYGIFAYECWDDSVGSELLEARFNDPADRNNNGYPPETGNGYELKAGREYFVCVMGADYYEIDAVVSVRRLVPATSISISGGEVLDYTEGMDADIFAELSPEFSVAGKITWESSDPSVLDFYYTELYDGRAYAYCKLLKEGEVQLTVRTENGLSDTVTVRVKGLPCLKVGEETVAAMHENMAKYAFIPEEDGAYVFTVRSEEFEYKELWIENADGESFGYAADSTDTTSLRVSLEAGERYLVKLWGYADSYFIKAEKALADTSLAVAKNPVKTSYVKGCVEEALDLEGLELKIGYEDGTFKTVAYEDLYSNAEEISFEIDAETGVLTFFCEGAECTLALTLTDSPVARLELVSSTAKDLVENYHGHEDYRPNPQTGIYDWVFVYNLPDYNNYRIRVVYKDGTEKVVDPSEYLDGYRFQMTDDQDENPWGLGEHTVTMSYLGATLAIPVRVISNPVLSIDVLSPVKIIENVDGYWDYAWDEYGEGYEYFYYYHSDDIPVRVNYSDGSSKLANVSGGLDGEEFEYYNRQYEKPWVKGGNNVLYGRYLGVDFEIPVVVEENPVASITVDAAPSRVYVYGDILWGWMNDEGYCVDAEDLDGLKFTLNMKDGTKKTYTAADIDEEGKVDGYSISLRYNHMMELGENTVTMEYMGVTAEYKVTLVASPYASIQVATPLPYTTANGKYMPYFDGLSLRLTKTDGTTETVTATKKNVTLSPDGEGYLIKGENGLCLYVTVADFDPELGTVTFRVYCHDKYCDLAPLNVENEINVAEKVENVSMTSLESGGQVKVTWEDGTVETVTLQPNPEVLAEGERGASLLYQTEEGYLQAEVRTYRTEAGDVISYHLYFTFWNDHNGMVLIPAPEGDVETDGNGDLNGDGAVTSTDAIHLLYHTLFGGTRYPVSGDCDYNNDGAVTSADAIYLLYHALFGAGRYPLS